jgi:hypothetical protein
MLSVHLVCMLFSVTASLPCGPIYCVTMQLTVFSLLLQAGPGRKQAHVFAKDNIVWL